MKILNNNMGRRHFVSISSMILATGILARPSNMLFAAENISKGQEGPPQGDGKGIAEPQANYDGTKYGKYIVLSKKNEASERGIPVVATMGNAIPGCNSMALVGRMPASSKMPGHETHEKHDVPEYLIHLGNDPDDPMSLGADVELYLGRGKWRERYTFNKTTAVYVPAGLWHCPWHVTDIKKPMTFVNILVGNSSWGNNSEKALSTEELAKAKTSGYIFDKYLMSGVGKDIKDPKDGKMLAYTDCTKIASAPLTRIIRYRPEGAPYPIIDSQTHEYGTFFIYLGTDYNDTTTLGAEVELYVGPEKEKHMINKSALVYIPPDVVHGPFIVKNARKPFNFLEVVLGSEMPGAVYG